MGWRLIIHFMVKVASPAHTCLKILESENVRVHARVSEIQLSRSLTTNF